MPAQTNPFDVWTTDDNKVYRGVPYEIVSNWILEGRLLEKDRVRPSGGTTWLRLEEEPLLKPFLPKSEPDRPEDPAEALERLDVDFNIKPKQEADDDDVDMIPLIDISMVLLVFFMMTAQDLLTSSPLKIASAMNADAVSPAGSLSIGIKPGSAAGTVEYYLEDKWAPEEAIKDEKVLTERLERFFKDNKKPPSQVIIKADQSLPFEKVQAVTQLLQTVGASHIKAQVKHLPGGALNEGGSP